MRYVQLSDWSSELDDDRGVVYICKVASYKPWHDFMLITQVFPPSFDNGTYVRTSAWRILSGWPFHEASVTETNTKVEGVIRRPFSGWVPQSSLPNEVSNIAARYEHWFYAREPRAEGETLFGTHCVGHPETG